MHWFFWYNYYMVQTRKDPLKNDQCYHIFSRSIAKFVIFNNSSEFERMCRLIELYRFNNICYRYSDFNDFSVATQKTMLNRLSAKNDVLVEIIAFCLMPTHIHLILKQVAHRGISKYIGRVFNGYSRYFNVKHKRTGPLWSGRFKNILISNDDQLLHLTRYIHLNPTSAGLVKCPKNWSYSSYDEYTQTSKNNLGICKFQKIINKNPKEYRKFVEDGKSYQRQLSMIKNILIDNYSG